MAGTAKNYATTTIAKGPADVWLNVGLPAVGSEFVHHTDGTPDSTASPSAVHLGKLKEGARLVWKPSFEGQFSDETSAPYRYVLGAEEAMVSGAFLQVLDFAILEKMTPGATRTSPTGKEALKFGGLSTFSTYTVAVIWAMPEDPTKFVSWLLYKAFNEAGLEFDIKRNTDAQVPFQLRGLAISTRTAGDQIGAFVKQT